MGICVKQNEKSNNRKLVEVEKALDMDNKQDVILYLKENEDGSVYLLTTYSNFPEEAATPLLHFLPSGEINIPFSLGSFWERTEGGKLLLKKEKTP